VPSTCPPSGPVAVLGLADQFIQRRGDGALAVSHDVLVAQRHGRRGAAPQPDPYVWRGQAEHLADSLAKGDRVMVTGRLRQRSWETPEGDKRSVTELEADEVGASLKFATAKVERASERATNDRTQGRERQTERGDFNEPPPF